MRTEGFRGAQETLRVRKECGRGCVRDAQALIEFCFKWLALGVNAVPFRHNGFKVGQRRTFIDHCNNSNGRWQE